MTEIQQALLALADEKYRAFQCGLMPGVPPERVIGVRTPELRRFALSFWAKPEAEAFMRELPHFYYEENNLHAFLIERIAGFDRAAAALDEFLPYVDNWATCDMMRPRALGKNLSGLRDKIGEWLASGSTYAVRFGLEMLMTFFLDENFSPDCLETAAAVRSEEYYVRMMQAWFFATALAKQYDAAEPYLVRQALEPWTHNKAIQKAIESRRLTPAQKTRLRTMKLA